jgi:hypothetical protein
MGRIKVKDYWTLQRCCEYIYTLTAIKRKPNTILSWSRLGLIGQNGQRVKLKTCRRINNRYSTQVWLDDFLREVG